MSDTQRSDKMVQLLEQNVKHNLDDIRELKSEMSQVKSDVNDLKSGQLLANQTITSVMQMLEELRSDFRSVNEKIDKNQIEQLKEYKSGVWKIGVMVIGGLIVGALSVYYGV